MVIFDYIVGIGVEIGGRWLERVVGREKGSESSFVFELEEKVFFIVVFLWGFGVYRFELLEEVKRSRG